MNGGRIPGLARRQSRADDRCRRPLFVRTTFECPGGRPPSAIADAILIDSLRIRFVTLHGLRVYRLLV